MEFSSRRPLVSGLTGAAASDDHRATLAGIDVLKSGGNAADAAVAMAACLAVTNPMSTGLGGDAFGLFYEASSGEVKCINGSGRSGHLVSLAEVEKIGLGKSRTLPVNHGLTVTVPGAAAAWEDTVSSFGKLSLSQVLAPAKKLARDGFHVSEIASHFWQKGSDLLRADGNASGADLLLNGSAPKPNQLFRNLKLARVLESLGTSGKDGFYGGRYGASIVEAAGRAGGLLTAEDLAGHASSFEEAVSSDYGGVRIWEVGPSTQGVVALMALNVLKNFQIAEMAHNSPQQIHHVVESLKLAFSDALRHVADPTSAAVPLHEMLSDTYGRQRARLVRPNWARSDLTSGIPTGSDTVYLCAADGWGNACSFINSNYMGFGTGIVPEGCGFTLQNRGLNFSLTEGHANCLAPGKRPLHTIIPAMATDADTGALRLAFGVMGGFMQPQGHVQVLLNMIDYQMDPQKALDKVRFCVGPGHSGAEGAVSLEQGHPTSTADILRAMGHDVRHPVCGHGRALFGRGHVISNGDWWAGSAAAAAGSGSGWFAGSDPRADGLALAF